MITSKQHALIGLAALFAIASTQACGSDDPGTSPTPTAGAAGAHTGAAGMGVSGGGAASAGAPAAGAASAGAPTTGGGAGGAAAGAPATGGGSGGASAGSGSGSSAGSSGHGGGSAGGPLGAGGGGTATYAAVKAIFAASCGTGECHDGKMHTNYQKGELYTTLTTAIPATGGPATQGCKGSTLMTPGDANSFLVKVITGPNKTTCKNSGRDQMVERMPNKCGQAAVPGAPMNPACLSAADTKTISDWVAAGAPH